MNLLSHSFQKYESSRRKSEGEGRREVSVLSRPTEWVWGRQTIYMGPSGSEDRKRAGVKGALAPAVSKGAFDIRQGAADGARVVPSGR